MKGLKRWFRLLVLVPAIAGCGVSLYDHGSGIYTTGGINLVYAEWVVPKERDWRKDAYECDTEAREAIPSLVRKPGERQILAERCLTARGYVRR
ncbi:MAG: hypothetical protein ACRELZ_10120 [Candidatus Rokuibacteriota bacterium]